MPSRSVSRPQPRPRRASARAAASSLSDPGSRRWVVASALGAILLICGLLAACTAPPEQPALPRSIDFVTEPHRLTSTGEPPPPRQVFCADENRFALALEAGDEVTVLVELGEEPSLLLSHCAGRPTGDAEPGGGRLVVTAEPLTAGGETGAGAVSEEYRIPKHARWRRHQLDLAPLFGKRVRLRLEVDLPAGRQLFFQQLAIEHRVADEADRTASPVARDPGAPRQLLLISVDTLREDAIGALGGPWATPALDRFAAEAQRFSPHYSAANWTKPSHGTLLTGQLPPAHGATGFEQALRPGVPTLAERMRGGGLLTAGLVFDCLWLNPRFGFARGFDHYKSVHWTLPQQQSHALGWMTEHRRDDFFFFLHTFEVHSDFHRLPYEAPGVRSQTVAQRFGIADYGCRQRQCASGVLRKINEGEIEPLPGEEEIVRFLYGQGVEELDRQLGRLFDTLRELGIYDRMTIVLTSDHGEAFAEHGRYLHTDGHEENLRVPLLIKWPAGADGPDARAGTAVTVPTGAVDVAPTLLAAAGLQMDDLLGRDLASESLRPAPIFADADARVVVAGNLKAFFDPRGGPPRLYDLAADPGERANLAAERPEELARLEELMLRRLARDYRLAASFSLGAGEDEAALTGTERQRLKALGYVE